jgi:hypothetical protein
MSPPSKKGEGRMYAEACCGNEGGEEELNMLGEARCAAEGAGATTSADVEDAEDRGPKLGESVHSSSKLALSSRAQVLPKRREMLLSRSRSREDSSGDSSRERDQSALLLAAVAALPTTVGICISVGGDASLEPGGE